MASDLLKQASDQILGVFNALPRPRELIDVDVWKMIHDDVSGAIFTTDQTRDIYYSWVCAKVVKPAGGFPRSEGGFVYRFAVGIQWTGDELDRDLNEAVGRKVTRAVLGFSDMAEEFEEGGPLPAPIVGVPLLSHDRPVRITGIWLRHDGVLVSKGKGHGNWYKVINEPLHSGLSHIVESSGIQKSPVDKDTVLQYRAATGIFEIKT